MNVSKPIIILGIILVFLGIIFYLQGRAVIGPDTSFMYSNPEWITNGQEIIFSGILMMVIGLILKLNFKR